jgi:hypothetical protein
MQAAGTTLRSEIHKFINSILNKEERIQQWNNPFLSVYIKGDKTDCNHYRKYHSLQLHTKL